MQSLRRLFVAAALLSVFGLLLASCCKHEPANPAPGGVIAVKPYTSGPDTMMMLTSGPDTMGARAETLWVMKKDSILTIRFTAPPPGGPDTMVVGHGGWIVTKRLPSGEPQKGR